MRSYWKVGAWLAFALCIGHINEVESRLPAESRETGHKWGDESIASHNTPEYQLPPSRNAASAATEAQTYASGDGVVLWTLANYSWLDFVLNWVEMVKKAGIAEFFVATLDDELAEVLQDMGTPCVMLHTKLGGHDLFWGSNAFKQRGIEKIQFIIAMLELDMQPVFSDLDVVWLRDPRPFLASNLDPNILISSDSCEVQQATPLDDCKSIVGTERSVSSFIGMMNVGIHLIRPSALHFAKAWLEEMKETGEMEQLCWNQVFMRDLTVPATSDLYCRSMSGSIKAGILPAASFMNGQTAFQQHLKTALSLDPFAIHASWVWGAGMKRFHFREESMWMVDKDERFNSPSLKLLWLDLDVPQDLLSKAGVPENMQDVLQIEDVEGHLLLLHHQYLQVKAAAEMALILNRTLIMPRLYCGVENLSSPHRGRMWDGVQNYTLPMQCSMTQLFDVSKWKQEAKEKRVLPHFVESSFIDNAKLKLEDQDRMTLDVCTHHEGISTGINQSVCETSQGTLSIAPGLEKSQLLSLAEEFAAVKLVQVKNVFQFWPLATNEQYGKFDHAFDDVRRDWCCTRNRKRVFVDIGTAPNSDSNETQTLRFSPLQASSLFGWLILFSLMSDHFPGKVGPH